MLRNIRVVVDLNYCEDVVVEKGEVCKWREWDIYIAR
jgi:hypothetical protein